MSGKVILRTIVIGLGLLEAAVLVGFIVLMLQSSDPLGRSIGTAMAGLAAIPLGMLVLPGLGLAFLGRRLGLALALELLVLPVGAALWLFA